MDRVNSFINRLRGDASHAGVRDSMMSNWLSRCLDNSSGEANQRAISRLETFYKLQKMRDSPSFIAITAGSQ